MDAEHHYEELLRLGFDPGRCDLQYLCDVASWPEEALGRLLSLGRFTSSEIMSMKAAFLKLGNKGMGH
jgi:hypothetical protein